MNEFEDANKAAEALFQNQLDAGESEQPIQEQQQTASEQEQKQNQQSSPSSDETLENAVSTAERAAQAAVQQDGQIRQLQEQLQQMQSANQNLMEQNKNLNQAITQMSQAQQEAVLEEVVEMPSIDFNALAFDDEEEAAARQRKYADEMRAYVRNDIMKELEPYVTQAKEGLYQKEKDKALRDLSKVPELEGIMEVTPQLDAIIERNSVLKRDDVPMEEKLILAYAIMKGVDSINHPAKDPSAQELMEFYEKNPEFQELIEKKRLDAVKPNQQVPPLSASSGAVNAAINIPEKPKTIEEAHERARKLFGL